MDFIEKQPGCFWGFAYLRARTEKVVAESLQQKKIASYLPLVPKARLHHGSKVISIVPMISSYIFLSVNDEQRSELKKYDKNIVQIELQRNEYEEDILIRELNALRRFELLAQTEKVLVNPGIQRGSKVIVTQGPLKDLEADVIRRDDDNNSIIINITMLNKTLEYPVTAEFLKEITI